MDREHVPKTKDLHNISHGQNILKRHPVVSGFALRILLSILLPLLLDDGILLHGVKYTDIDYDVFTDAARHVARGESPFLRHTYRYTPFLASLLSYADYGNESTKCITGSVQVSSIIFSWWRKPRYFGRLLFCFADTFCGWVILTLRRRERQHETVQAEQKLDPHPSAFQKRNIISVELQDSLWWLYNPLPINICTRGSAESFVVILPVLATVTLVTLSNVNTPGVIRWRALWAGLMHGLAIHAKLYPVIYTASFMAYLSRQEQIMMAKGNNESIKWRNLLPPLSNGSGSGNVSQDYSNRALFPFPWLQPKRLTNLIFLWVDRLFLTSSSIIFLLASLVTFATLTYLAVLFYGNIALEEGLLYHFSRVDHRHNYSMFWYWIYLARGRSSQLATFTTQNSSFLTLGRVLLIPQMILLLYSSLGIAPYDLHFCLFLQTFLFVAQNKVMTAQYFTWYLCLLPLCADRIRWNNRRCRVALSSLGVSIGVWLGCAFVLEMKGLAFHGQVWVASIGFFLANVNLFRAILMNYRGFRVSEQKCDGNGAPNACKKHQ
jgi:phosphatidylinositol glycan class M